MSMNTNVKLRRLLTVADIQNQHIERIPFEGKWYDAFKQPQDRGFWLVYGVSTSGKSSFVMQLAKELANYYKVLYNLLEEELDDSDYIDRTELFQMQDVKKNFFTQKFTPEELDAYLQRKQSAKVVIIDSAPYFFEDWEQYKAFKAKWAKNKIIIIVGQAEGTKLNSELQKKINFDAKMKIFVSGFKAVNKGRTFGPTREYIVWQEGYESLYGRGESEGGEEPSQVFN